MLLPHVILHGVTPDDLYAWLSECIELAQQEMALHPLRPQPHAMIPYRPPIHELFRFSRRMAGWYVGIYEVLPADAPPFGAPLMLIAGGLRGCAPAPGHVHIGLWRDRRFPLEIAELAWELEERFPSVPAPGSPLASFLRPTDVSPPPIGFRPAPPAETPMLPPTPPPSASPPSPRRTAGLHPSTEWLVQQFAALPDPVDPEPLYQAWAERYRQHEGLIPRDSARSFDKAVDSALKQLGRIRRRRRSNGRSAIS